MPKQHHYFICSMFLQCCVLTSHFHYTSYLLKTKYNLFILQDFVVLCTTLLSL